MNRTELLERIVQLEQEIRELKAKGESGHCFGCLCRQNVIYYPGNMTSTSYTATVPSNFYYTTLNNTTKPEDPPADSVSPKR